MNNVDFTTIYDKLTEALGEVFEPLVSSLDDLLAPNGANQDTGQTTRSQQDVGIRIILDSLLRQTERQLRGAINARNGNKIPNIVDRWNESQETLRKFEERYEGDRENMFADPQYLDALVWAEVNEHRYEAVNAIHTALARTYHDITGEKWEMREITPQNTQSRTAELQARFRERYAAQQ